MIRLFFGYIALSSGMWSDLKERRESLVISGGFQVDSLERRITPASKCESPISKANQEIEMFDERLETNVSGRRFRSRSSCEGR